MKRNATAVSMFLLLVLGTVASGPALAQHFGHGHGHGGVRLGISFGTPFHGPAYYPGRYYAYPAYAYPPYAYPAPAYAYPGAVAAPATTYIEQGYAQQGMAQAAPPAPPNAAPAPVQQQGDWFYCADSRTYYPYARECAGGWQRVPSTPPSR